METYSVDDYVQLSGKVPTYGRVTAITPKGYLVEMLETIEKTKNVHIQPLFPEEMALISKRVEVTQSKVSKRVSVYFLSDFVKKYYNTFSKSFDTENMLMSGDFLVRFMVTGQGLRGVMVLGSPLDICICRNKDIAVNEIVQCQKCNQIYHDRCRRQKYEECQCTLLKDTVELKKRESTIDFDSVTIEPASSTKINTSGSLQKDTANPPKNESKEPKSEPVSSLKRVNTGDQTDVKTKSIMSLYDERFPTANAVTQIDKARMKVKRILFEALLSAVLELCLNHHTISFEFSIQKVESISAYTNTKLFEFVTTITQELEAELMKLSINIYAIDSAYMKKARFFSMAFKKEKLNQLLVQFILGRLTAKQLVAFEERDFLDKKKLESYQALFLEARAMQEEEIVMKNYKGLVDIDKSEVRPETTTFDPPALPDTTSPPKPITKSEGQSTEKEIRFFVTDKHLGFDLEFYKAAGEQKIDEVFGKGNAEELKERIFGIGNDF